jgi:pimeloyl-ACP methyl ester carboxylesterase
MFSSKAGKSLLSAYLQKLHNLGPKIFVILLLATSLVGCESKFTPELRADYRIGETVTVEDVYGVFFVYAPTSMPSKPDLLVLIHGTPGENLSAEETARYYIEHWIDFAEEEGVLLIAPAFDHENFSSRKGEIEDKLTGYRGLFGREIGGDEWVLRIVDAYQQTLLKSQDKFWLYGHSAGGQFVGRFLMTHPERVEKAVITAAATYPQPDPDIAWPFGMGELHTEIEWDERTIRREDIIPDKQNWLEATQVPLTVLVGLNDIVEQPQRPGQRGTNRVTIARNWVQSMKSFARENGLECGYEIHYIAGKGHSMYGLVEFSQEAMRAK